MGKNEKFLYKWVGVFPKNKGSGKFLNLFSLKMPLTLLYMGYFEELYTWGGARRAPHIFSEEVRKGENF